MSKKFLLRKPDNKISRRSLIKNLGYGSLLYLPVIRAERAMGQEGKNCKALFMVTPNGTAQEYFWPKGGEYDFQLSEILADLAPHKKDLIICDGLVLNNRTSWHHPGCGALLTGYNYPVPKDNEHFFKAPAESVDRYLGRTVGNNKKFASFHLGVHLSRYGNYGRSSFAIDKSSPTGFSPIVPHDNPRVAFDQLFADYVAMEQPGEVDKFLNRKRLLVDFLIKNYNPTSLDLSVTEQAKVADHFDMLRDLQKTIDSGESVNAFTCAVPKAPDKGYNKGDASVDIDLLARVQCELAVAALACDLTDVVNLHWFGEGSSSGITSTIGSAGTLKLRSIHGISHRTYGFGPASANQKDIPADIVAANGRRHRDIEKFYCHHLNGMINQMKGLQTNLFDRSVIMWSSTFAQSYLYHTSKRMPIVLIGSANGQLKTGRYVKLPEGASHTGVLSTICTVMGNPTRFGDPAFALGPFKQLLNA